MVSKYDRVYVIFFTPRRLPLNAESPAFTLSPCNPVTLSPSHPLTLSPFLTHREACVLARLRAVPAPAGMWVKCRAEVMGSGEVVGR